RTCSHLAPAPPEPATLSLHDARPIFGNGGIWLAGRSARALRACCTCCVRVDYVLRGDSRTDGGHEADGGIGQRRTQRPRTYDGQDRKSTRLNSSHVKISYAVFCLKKK